MSRSQPKNRELTQQEVELWRVVTANVVPRHPQRVLPSIEMKAPGPPPVREHKPSEPPQRFAEPAKKPLGIIDRRAHRDLRRGRLEIDARLDLHGLRVAEAHNRVLAFLARAQQEGARVALIVTGKGARQNGHGDGYEGGVLRRQTPLWLADPALRHIVAAFGEAAQPHGGLGALYVRLRKR